MFGSTPRHPLATIATIHNLCFFSAFLFACKKVDSSEVGWDLAQSLNLVLPVVTSRPVQGLSRSTQLQIRRKRAARMCQSRITDPAAVTWNEVPGPFQKLCWPDCWAGRVQREEWCPEDGWELALQLWKSLLCRPPCLAFKALEHGMNGDRRGFLRGRSAWSGRALEFERQRYLRRENFALRGDAGNNLIAQRELSKHARSRRTPMWHRALKKGWFFAELQRNNWQLVL